MRVQQAMVPILLASYTLMVFAAAAATALPPAHHSTKQGRGPTRKIEEAENNIAESEEREYTTQIPERVIREGEVTEVSCYDTTSTVTSTTTTGTPTTTEEGDTTTDVPETTERTCVTTVKSTVTTTTTATTPAATPSGVSCYETTTTTITRTTTTTNTGTPTTTEEGQITTSITQTTTTTTTCTTTTTASTTTTTTSATTITTSTTTTSTATTITTHTSTTTTTITTTTTATSTQTASATSTATSTQTASATFTFTSTGTSTDTFTAVSTITTTPTNTGASTVTSTATATITSSATSTQSNTGTSTITSTATSTVTSVFDGIAAQSACEEGFVGVVDIGSEHKRSNVVCRKLRVFQDSLQHKLDYKVTASWGSGFGAVPPVLSMDDDNVTYSSSILAATHLSNARVTVALGGFSKRSETISSDGNAAAIITGLLRTTSVRHDDAACFPSGGGCSGPSVGASFQLRDDVTFSTSISRTEVTVTVVPSAESGVGPISKTFTCATSICHTNVPLTSTFRDQLPAGPQTLTVTYKLGNKAALTLPGSVTWYPAPEAIASVASMDSNTVYTVVPARDLFPGDTFNVQVRSLFRSYLKTALVRVTVGSGLTITGDSVPDTAFKQTSVDRNGQQASAVLAGRKDGKPSAVQGAATDELLLTLSIRVNGNVQAGSSSTIQITRLADLTDLNENGLNPSSTGMVETRDGVKTDEVGRVYFKTDGDVGIFPYVSTSNPTELINTASVSGKKIEVPIITKGISIRGVEAVKSDSQCTLFGAFAATLGVSKCKATLTGAETVGARKIEISVTSASGTATVPFRVHQLVPNSVEMVLGRTTLRPYAGLWDESDTDCKTLQYQSTPALVTATFADGSGQEFSNYDVSSIVRLASSAGSVAAVDGFTIAGKSAGTAGITVRGKSGVLATKSVVVLEATAANMLGMVGIDVVLLDGIGNVQRTGDGTYARDAKVGLSIGAYSTKELSYEGDDLTVMASAVFEDDSRLALTADMGLVIKSHDTTAVTVSGSKLVVPVDPQPASGPIVGISWIPEGDCQDSNAAMSQYMSKNITITVKPPVAKAMTATSSKSFIVVTDDGATAAGAAFPTQAQLSVGLTFEEKSQNNLQADTRTKYVPLNPELFTVDDKGKVTANSKGNVGSGSVNVTFEGQVVFKIVEIVVAKLASVSLRAVPFPTFSNSNSEDVTRVSKIACTNNYQQTQFIMKVKISNGAAFNQEKDIGGQNFDIETVGSAIQVSDGSSRVGTASAEGMVTFVAKFGINGEKMASNEIKIAVSDTVVTVASIDGFRLMAGTSTLTTLKGYKDSTTAQLQLGITLSDNRKYTAALSSDGSPALPGLLTFSSDTTTAIKVDDASGLATLVNNHYDAVVLSAKTCESFLPQVNVDVSVYANLDPRGADVDVGASSNWPVPKQSKGSGFTVPIRVNTNGKTLKAFNVMVAYNADDLDFVKVQHTIASNKGSVEFKPGRSAGNADLEAICALAGLGKTCAVAVATISNSKVKGGSAPIFEATFKVKTSPGVASLTYISGVAAQLLDTAQGGGETIGTKNTVFVSGNIPVFISDGNRRQRRRRSAILPNSLAQNAVRRALPTELRLRKGDSNCDDDFDLKDASFILDYVAARGNDFTTALGSLMTKKVAACQAKLGLTSTDLAFMDPDSNTEITLLDLTYMLDILAGNFAFMLVNVPDPMACKTEFSVEMTTAQGGAVPAGTRLFLDFAMDKSANAALYGAINASGLVTTEDKGAVALNGALVELEADVDDPTMYSMNLDVLVPFDSVGVSAIQISSNPAASPQWKFFGGKPTNGFDTSTYKGVLTYSQSVIGASTDLTLTNGYNAMSDLDHAISGTCTTATSTTTTVSTTTTTATTTTTTTMSSTTTTTHTTTTTTTVSTTTTTTSSTTISSTTTTYTSTTTTTPTPVVITIVLEAECTADTDVAAVATATAVAITAAVGPGMLRDDIPPTGNCGSIVIQATATSADAAGAINQAVADGLVTVELADGVSLQAENLQSKGKEGADANNCDVAAASGGPRAKGDPRESTKGCGLQSSHIVSIVVGCILVLLAVGVIVWHRHEVKKHDKDKNLESVEMGDFDDTMEVGKMTKNPLHKDANNTQETAFAGAGAGGGPKAIISLKDVWGVSEDGEDEAKTPKPIIRRDSLFEIWGTDEEPPDIDTDVHREGSIMLSGHENGERRQSTTDGLVESDVEYVSDDEETQPLDYTQMEQDMLHDTAYLNVAGENDLLDDVWGVDESTAALGANHALSHAVGDW